MKLLEGPFAEWPRPERGAAVTIGVYDGVHRGHQSVIAGLREAGRARELDVTVVTFRRHPAELLAPDRVPAQLTTLDRRLELLADLGVDQVALLDFDDELRMQTPDDFVHAVLVEGLDVRLVSVGAGFRFGHRQSGDVALLAELGEGYGFEVASVPLVGGAEPFSATRIRRALAAGDLETAHDQLGRPFAVCGVVGRGDGRGRTIGVPTANLALVPHQALPAGGVYAVTAHVDGASLPAVANIGVRPTFGGADVVFEVHVLDADLDLYGKEVRVVFVARIRDEQTFAGVDALVTQIHADIDQARSLLGLGRSGFQG